MSSMSPTRQRGRFIRGRRRGLKGEAGPCAEIYSRGSLFLGGGGLKGEALSLDCKS